ncbi:MAG: hypothetical protein LBE18_01325 [Planctomycetaceae bacterium]|jgi:hypothetical protein|nr:hypothetical protein [Planctomycetaceae bacterium]
MSEINSTEIGKALNMPSQKINKLLAELSYIEKNEKGWSITPLGEAKGGKQKKHFPTNNLFVTWNESIIETLKKTNEPTTQTQQQTTNENEKNFREQFPAKLRTTDGHFVRSRAELLIDNWLYSEEIVHAYERKLPIEEETYCDFYLPKGKIYIEFWGLENNEKYIKRKKKKIETYQKYQMNLIELKDNDIENLDDFLPNKLIKFGYSFN